MSKERLRFEKLLSLVQGASWALALGGSFYLFFAFLPFGFIAALIVAFICFLMGFFFVGVCEIAQIQIEKLEELRKHTHLLEGLRSTKSELL